MKNHDPLVDSLHSEAPRFSEDAMSSERLDPNRTPPVAPGGIARQRMRVAGRTLGSLLLGGAAILGSVLVFRQGLLPLIDAVFQPGPELLSAFRRAGILLTAMAGYWAFVHWHEKREATELRLRPIHLMLGGASGTVHGSAADRRAVRARRLRKGAVPRRLAGAARAWRPLSASRPSWKNWSTAACCSGSWSGPWERALALVAQALIFAVEHLENVEQGRISDVVTMLVSVTLLGLLWAGLFVLARNLWVVAANHAAWNFTILLSGVPLSGIEDWRALAPFESRFAGPDWLTGGHVRSGEFVAGDRVDHGRGCAAAARGTAAWGLPRAGDLDRQAHGFGMRRDVDEAVGS